MRITTLVLCSACVLASCESGPPPASQAEQDAAAKAVFDCLIKAAYSDDDGISDALSIGAAIFPACAQVYDAWVRTDLRGESDAVVYVRARQSLLAAGPAEAAGVVLEERKDRKKGLRPCPDKWGACRD